MDFKEIFQHFFDHRESMKVINVASCTMNGLPNGAPKMLVDVVCPNLVYFIDFKSTHTYKNIVANPVLSLSFMEDRSFMGFRLNGPADVLGDDEEYGRVRKTWKARADRYEVDRIIDRVKGKYSARSAENALPENFVIVRFTAEDAAVVMPDRIFRAQRKDDEA